MHKKVHMPMVAIYLGHLVSKKEYKLQQLGQYTIRMDFMSGLKTTIYAYICEF